ncbi:MAG TPA: PadR family transcriptional regulator [Solirubrobacteraceae bacterium]|nr:PadR family transcriptional regulator [Solirubrobacteraceae bacterium]
MSGAYALDWSGPGAWAEHWGRGCGPHDRGHRSRHERARYGEDDSRGARRGGHGSGRHGGRRARHGGGSGFPLEALAWALAFAKGGDRGPRGRGHHGPTPEQLEMLMALREMRGGPGPFGRGPRGRGRRRRGDVRLAVLRLLAEEPRNGYQLMQTIEERSEGQWRPSPGSMYPTLSQLEDEGLIGTDSVSRLHHLTDSGREALEERAGEPDPWLPEPDAGAHAMSELGPRILGLGKAVWQVASVGDERQRARAAELLDETRRRLYGLLAEEPEDAADDADDLDDAADDRDDPDPGAGEHGPTEV